MKFTVITLFPDFIKTLESYSIIGRALKNKKIAIKTINLRDFGLGRYRQVDDRPFGGDPGMLLRVDVAVLAIRKAIGSTSTKSAKKIVLLCPTGKKFNQEMAEKIAVLDELILVCGHYEGFDKRIEDYVDEKISIGNYVLSGGELPAMTIIDAVSRQIPGVLQNPKSLKTESFSASCATRHTPRATNLEFPQYTRPAEFEGKKVPEVLLSGDPKKIAKWQEQSCHPELPPATLEHSDCGQGDSGSIHSRADSRHKLE